ncbi:L-idonate 5-dehydrogenase [Labrys monachus]|uniref:L-idonate 5-dehydrogenase n=1 Tax=Labrys monachus TaxID=217067 RepID=A0ABU0FMG4_9HYPH|nr:L-idonate 5-dehydrogenase [Labrys monachus]MDQ0395283.1 L-idonate 5-dehydrogenase [Labrys monachus]
MKAVVIHAAGDLRVEDVAASNPGPNDVEVRIGAGGICGSDLHYYRHGGFGTVRLKEPMILGHEIAGTVTAVGTQVTSLVPGQKVAVNPSRACGVCRFCREGLQNHCLDMRFYGSAMRFPHVQGGFRESLTCDAAQAVPVPDHVSLTEAAFAEPLAVCLHAVTRAGSLLGKRVLVTGAGPIGVLIAAAARRAGALEIVVTDIVDAPLAIARTVGVDRTVNVAEAPEGLEAYERDKGVFDVMFEAAGSAATLLTGLRVVRPRGLIVQVGQGAEATLPMSLIVTKEVEVRGAFRFHEEFATAVSFIADRLVDVRPLLTDVVALDDARRAFDLASDKSRSMKVQLAFG